MFLKVELSGAGTCSFEDFEDLWNVNCCCVALQSLRVGEGGTHFDCFCYDLGVCLLAKLGREIEIDGVTSGPQ
jgi:hypothetical protein